MKPTTAACIALMLVAGQPAWATDANPDDPYERYNRMMYKVNDGADRYVFSPVARGYRTVTPKPVRAGVSNFFNNLRDVVSFGSNVLRLDLKRASEDLVRVGINTTFGLGGLINIADAGDIPNNKNSLGDTFASWGWKKSNYFVYPLLGPSTVRDSVGTTIISAYPVQNAVFDQTTARISARTLDAVSTREGLLDFTDSLNAAAVDKYAYTRDIYMSMRAQQTGAPLPQGDDIDIDDLVDTDNNAALPEDGSSTDNTEMASAELQNVDEAQQPAEVEPNTLWQPNSRLAY